MKGYTIAVVTITKILTEGDIVVSIETGDADGEQIALVDALGMLELGKHSLLQASTGECAELDAGE